MATQKNQGKYDYWILGVIGTLLVSVWGLFPLLLLYVLRSAYSQMRTPTEPILSQLGTFGDMFGALTCLFTGLAFIGAGYAVVLQLRALRHQQEEIEQNRRDQEATAQARKRELRASALWERRTAALNATSFIAQSYAAQIAVMPEGDIPERIKKSELQEQLSKMITLMANQLKQFSEEQSELFSWINADQAGPGV